MNEVEEKMLRSFLKDLVSAQFESTREAVTEQIVLLVNDFAAQQSAHADLLRADPRSAVAHPTSESTADNRRAKSATSG